MLLQTRPKHSGAPEGYTLLRTVSGEAEASILRGLLDEAEIPCYARDRDSSSYLRIVAGYSAYGTDFFVPSELYDKAKELTDAYFRPDEELPEEELEEEAENSPSEEEDSSFADEETSEEGPVLEESSSGLPVWLLVLLIVLAIAALILVKTLL